MVIKAPLSLLSSRLNQPSFLPFLMCQASQTFDYPCGFSLDPFQPVHGSVGFMDIRDQSWTQRTQYCRCGLTSAEWDNGDFISAVDAVHHVGFFCHNSTLLTHMELLVHQDPQIPFQRAAPQTGASQPVLHSWIMFCQVQDLTLVLVELLKVLCTSYQCPFSSQRVFFCFSISGTLVHFSSGFEQIQRFTVKPRRPLALPLSWP